MLFREFAEVGSFLELLQYLQRLAVLLHEDVRRLDL